MIPVKTQPGMHVCGKGQLHFGDIPLNDLAEQFGTPLYVLNEETIRDNLRRYATSFQESYPSTEVAYAGKAFLCQAMIRLVHQEGLSLDVVSGGELHTALSAGFPATRIIFHGLNRTHGELKLAVQNGVGRLVVDNLAELTRIREVCRELGMPASLLLRVASGVKAHTHHYVQTSQPDSKFGFSLAELPEIVAQCASDALLKVSGLHCHIGSQIRQLEPFTDNLKILLAQFRLLANQGYKLSELNIGGGLGVYYTEGDEVPSIEEYTSALGKAAREEAKRLSIDLPHLIIEPGRSIINEAGLTLYRVGGSKKAANRTYLFVDGGMTDNIRPALYEAKYQAVLANRVLDRHSETLSISGRCCESGDMLIWDTSLPEANPGDLLAVLRTGAYNYAMANNYNRLPRPAVVLINNGQAHVIVERESYEDIVRLDRVPDHLAIRKPPRTLRIARVQNDD